MKKILLVFILGVFLSGCAVILNEDDKIKSFGIRHDEAADTLGRINSKNVGEKHQIHWWWNRGK